MANKCGWNWNGMAMCRRKFNGQIKYDNFRTDGWMTRIRNENMEIETAEIVLTNVGTINAYIYRVGSRLRNQLNLIHMSGWQFQNALKHVCQNV